MLMHSFLRSPFSILKGLFLITLLLTLGPSYASTGLFFNVAETGTSDPLRIKLALNGIGPVTVQNYLVNALNLSITTTVPNHIYNFAGIKIEKPGYRIAGLAPFKNGYYLFRVGDNLAANLLIIPPNPPWYPSLQAFEHYNSGRSHVFPEATFGGSLTLGNVVDTLNSLPLLYPSGYNMSYLDADHAYIYGGGYGDIAGSIGAYVDRVDPNTLERIWHRQLIITAENGEWDYPGSMGILEDGFIYVSYGYRLAKITPDGEIVKIKILPTGGIALPENTSFNGFNATSDGYIVMKSVYRQAGCTYQGPDALLNCPDPTDVPPSILISVDPKTMEVVDNITLPAAVGARPTITTYQGKNYVYLLAPTTAFRYEVKEGKFIPDNSWNPGMITVNGQTLCTSFSVMNDWVVAQTNTLPASTALSVIAIHQGDASIHYSLQPFLGDPIPPLVEAAFATAGPDASQAISWAPMAVSSDSDNNLIYASDALPGKIAAITITNKGLETVWKASQTTTEFTTLIGPSNNRVLVGTDIPGPEIPGTNLNDYAVWRNAATGVELARSPLLPAMTQGTMIQPYYNGDMFYEGQLGRLIKLMPRPL
ncbi:hypothetical protein [Criblamydia sequanensis]|uniref:Conserved putative secreted protein n=1 Tax=Candidatus Criblamydia sequanensis CRIB-18 TaxID=1437425 RepID=A0A090D0N0_9BACT|nr:hypothetical protein [Criblamydia sequanensis]CDR34871.1 Conserved putative secreted protein [Criblamydia sequanensis CRIB-18]